MTRSLSVHCKVSTLALAVALVVGPSPTVAQSFNASGSFTHGGGNIATPDSITTNITIDTPTAVIDWTPDPDSGTSGQDIVFQAGGTFATFSSATDFAVLNRIDVDDMTRMIRMDGTISSLVDGSTGGSVYFYSPSGIVLGATSIIDVGSLVLTSLPVSVDGNGNFNIGGTVEFGTAAEPFGNSVNPAARIETHPLSSISALAGGSYIALVAPRVQHHGTINVDGSAALVGAEAATITFRPNGLFDIQFDVGTTDANGVAVYGDITGPDSSGPGDNHRVYLAAVPKNTAMTMLIAPGAQLGFDVAGAADVDGNAVVLSAGHDVFNGSAQVNGSPASGAAANANILNASFTSAFYGTASGNIDITAAGAGFTDFASDVGLRSSGGYVQVRSLNADTLLGIDGNLSITTDRDGDDNGQSVTAGPVSVLAQDSGQMFIDGSVDISANGYGGGSSTAGVPGGNGTGGQVLIRAEANSFLTIGGNLLLTADGYGGWPAVPGASAGNGQGGNVYIGTTGNAARLEVVGTTTAYANGNGGNGDGLECIVCDGLGGTGTGGIINLGTGAGTGSTAYFGDIVALHGDGLGGRTVQAGTASGTGFGGEVNVFAAGGNQVEGYGLTFASSNQNLPDLIATANGRGGASPTSNTTAGLGDAGIVRIFASANSTMGIFGDLEVDADGFGGHNDVGDGGDGLGGQVQMFVDGGNAFINVAGTADLQADGEGSTAGSDCTECGGVGGDGVGGNVRVFNGSGSGNSINFANSLDLSAEGYGGIGVTGVAGIGQGGQANVNISNGFVVTVGAGLTIEADATGGTGFNGNAGGAGIGGGAVIDGGGGGSLTVTGNTSLDASGVGGNTDAGDGGTGGNGTGGGAAVQPGSGTFNFLSGLFISAAGEGGDSSAGTGGNAIGGRTAVNAAGSDIHVFANLSLDGSAAGGDGNVGGNATALISNVADESDPIAAGIYAMNNGSLDIDGTVIMSGEAVGGNGSNGNGGSASAGEIDVVAFFGDITIQSLAVTVNGYGGNGGNGGNGGSGQAGAADITFGLGAAAVGGVIDLGSAFVTADGFGGAGGAGINGAVGGNGGAGGAGTGGNVALAGTAAGGMLHSGAAIITMRGEGGDGGSGGTGSSGAGGTGGAGGVGRGGFVQTGTLSADMSPTTGGGATYTSLSLDAGAFGGTGGNGGTGATVNGVGGIGGNAFGGRTTFLVRGVLVTANTVTMLSGATGGNGGLGSTQGNGGNATTGTIAVESKDRFGHPDQRGTLQAGTITGTAQAFAGTGNVNGTSTVTDGSYFRVLNGDATIGSVSITLSGTTFVAPTGPSRVSVRDGLADIDNFSFITTGQLTLDGGKQTVDSLFDGRMVSDSITLSARTFVPDTDPAPAVPGIYQAGTFDISTNGDFITNANLISGSDLTIDAPGSIVARNINAVGPVDLFAGLNATTGNITSGDAISVVADTGGIVGGVMNAGDTILLDGATGVSTGVLGNLTAAGNIQVLSGGPIVTGIVRSNGGNILVDGDGSVSVESVNAFGSATLLAGTSFNTGNIDAGGPVTITATTGTMDIGNMVAGGNVNLTAGDSILGEDIITPGSIIASTGTGLLRLELLQSGGNVDLTAGGNLSNLNVTAAGLVDLFAGGDVATGNIDANGLIAVVADTGGIAGGSMDSGASILLDGATGVSTGALGNLAAVGNIQILSGGAIVTGNATSTGGNLNLSASGNISTLDLTAAGLITIFSSGGGILTGDLSGTNILVDAGAGDFEFGDVDADLFDFDASGAVNGGNIVAATNATGSGGGAVVLGNITVSGPPPVEEFSVGISSATSIQVGNVSGTDKVGFATFGDLATGDIQAGNLIMALVGGDITTGSLTATGLNSEIYFADSQMYVDAGGLDDNFELSLVLNAEPIPTGGSITINGPVDASFIRMAAGGLLTFNGDVTAESSSLMSGDIQLGSGVTVSGFTGLYSINSDGTFIGDGLAGPGYMLSNAEYNAFENVSMEVRPDLGAAARLVLGDLNIGSSITDAAFGIEDADDNDVGTIRVVGDVRMNNAAGELFFESETFQLDAATGSIVISSDGTTPGGELIIAANNIHVAEGSILDQLADDPQYSGYQDDLNDPASVPRPNGVIRAGTVTIEFGDTPADLYTLFVQNMGTEETPAGFVITDMNLGDDGETTLPAGSVDLIINGQIVTQNGTLTGIDVRNLLVQGRDLTPFTDNSTINGCVLVGECAVEPPPPPPPPETPLDRPDFQPSPGIQQEIVLAEENVLPPPDFGNEDFIDDNDEETEDSATSPIVPPDPLFDTSALGEESEAAAPEVGTTMRSSPSLTQPGDVDDPVSGSGNPALMETQTPPSSQEKQQ